MDLVSRIANRISNIGSNNIAVTVDSPTFSSETYKDFKAAVTDAGWKYDKNTGYAVVPKELLKQQGELLVGYIKSIESGKRDTSVDINILLDSAFKIRTYTGLTGLQVAQQCRDHATSMQLITKATPEQLFLQTKEDNNSLLTAVKMGNDTDAVSIITKKDVTREQLMLKDNPGKDDNGKYKVSKTALDYAVENQMGGAIRAIGRVCGSEIFKPYSKNAIVHKAITDLGKEERDKLRASFRRIKGGKYSEINSRDHKIIGEISQQHLR